MRKIFAGYIVLEALLSIVVLSMVVLSVFPMLSFLLKRSERSRYEARAGVLLQEAMEISYNVLLSGWDSYTEGEYKPALDAVTNRWVLVSGEDTNLETRFSRSIKISYVCRNLEGGKPIDPEIFEPNPCPGILDAKSKWIKTTVSWDEAGEVKKTSANLLALDLSND